MMRMWRAVGLLCLSTAGFAQQLTISGTVQDPQAVAQGISVTLRHGGGTQRTTTDSGGQYRFEGLSAGLFELSFSGSGFETATRSLSLTPESRVVDLTLSLSGVSTTLQVVDVAGKATSSRMEIPDLELPVQVSTISNQVSQQQGVNDMVTALRNASGVTAQRFYGIYEYYTIRGFFGSNVMLVDGMRIAGNRINTQLNNVEEVEVLKGPSSLLYGSGALGGAINVVRKQPQGQRAYDVIYRVGRFNKEQVGGGATGPLGSCDVASRVSRWMYHGLHSLDFPWLYAHRPAWDIVVLLLMLGGVALSVTSVILAVRVMGRAGRLWHRATLREPLFRARI